jgi:hypothetical protein
MSVQTLRTTLNSLFGKTLTVSQVQRISSAFYVPVEDQTNDEAASIVLNKIRKRILDVVRTKEGEVAASQARQSAEQQIDTDFL